ncbi:hypothetical protein RvY_16897 [Ramazzottius varieornatus]|uniref:G-protein coupled receptors family 1 profile domain-containing protein n=1 Tax=Ramazzottius varieornatus TaxID=947166 RepID=A0A1D1W056_RAMVA|nr:hypothetical protein RvY_16897 [Ramazzottius varieornatus]
MNSSNNSTQSLSEGSDSPSHFIHFTTYYALASDIATFVFNSTILIALLHARQAVNSFMVYVVQLTVSEVLLALTALPGNFVRSFYGFWPFGDPLCFAFSYFDSVFQSGVRYSHAMITLNRFWAAFFPVHYRNVHTRKAACGIVAAMWLFVHAIQLPSVIVGRVSPTPGDTQCILNLASKPGLVVVSSKALVWDGTSVNTLCQTYVDELSQNAGYAINRAEELKRTK